MPIITLTKLRRNTAARATTIVATANVTRTLGDVDAISLPPLSPVDAPYLYNIYKNIAKEEYRFIIDNN
jgi:hypothetical protein